MVIQKDGDSRSSVSSTESNDIFIQQLAQYQGVTILQAVRPALIERWTWDFE